MINMIDIKYENISSLIKETTLNNIKDEEKDYIHLVVYSYQQIFTEEVFSYKNLEIIFLSTFKEDITKYIKNGYQIVF